LHLSDIFLNERDSKRQNEYVCGGASETSIAVEVLMNWNHYLLVKTV
jgi:hypothetical protein